MTTLGVSVLLVAAASATLTSAAQAATLSAQAPYEPCPPNDSGAALRTSGARELRCINGTPQSTRLKNYIPTCLTSYPAQGGVYEPAGRSPGVGLGAEAIAHTRTSAYLKALSGAGPSAA